MLNINLSRVAQNIRHFLLSFFQINRYVRLANFATSPFTRFQRSYAALYDHYLDYWRFRLQGEAERREARFPFIGQIKKFFGRLESGAEKIKDLAEYHAQRRSWSNRPHPRHHRPHPRHPRPFKIQHQRQERQYSEQPDQEHHYGPPPSAPSVEEVKPLHELDEVTAP